MTCRKSSPLDRAVIGDDLASLDASTVVAPSLAAFLSSRCGILRGAALGKCEPACLVVAVPDSLAAFTGGVLALLHCWILQVVTASRQERQDEHRPHTGMLITRRPARKLNEVPRGVA